MQIPKVDSQVFLSDRILLRIIGVIFVGMILGSLALGNGTFVDVIRGYVSFEQYFSGEAFNTLNYDVAEGKIRYFIAWWTPAQYLLPYSFSWIGVPLWFAQGIWIFVFTGLSLFGYFRLFQNFGFSRNRSLLSVLLIQTNQLFFWNTLLYFGGSLFELGLLPWFLLFVFRRRSPFLAQSALIYTIVALALFFFKATFLIHAGLGLAVILLTNQRREKREIGWVLTTGLLIFCLCYFSFLRFGETPSSTHDYSSYNAIPNTFWMDWTTPFSSVFGVFSNVGTIAQKLFVFDDAIRYVGLFIFPSLAILGAWLFFRLFFWGEKERKLVVFSLLFFTCFLYFYVVDLAISYDYRHFAPLAFVFVPFCLSEIEKRIKVQRLFRLGINLLVLLNLSLFVLERCFFQIEMREHDGLFYTTSEYNELEAIDSASKLVQPDARILVVDNWSAMQVLKNKNVLPVFYSDGKWCVKSGIEVSRPKEIRFVPEFKNDTEILVFTPTSSNGILEKIDDFQFETLNLTRNWQICRGRKTPTSK